MGQQLRKDTWELLKYCLVPWTSPEEKTVQDVLKGAGQKEPKNKKKRKRDNSKIPYEFQHLKQQQKSFKKEPPPPVNTAVHSIPLPGVDGEPSLSDIDHPGQ